MMIKDYLSGVYVFGEHTDGVHVDIAFAGDDICEHIARKEAETIIGLIGERANAIYWLLDKIDMLDGGVSHRIHNEFFNLINAQPTHARLLGAAPPIAAEELDG